MITGTITIILIVMFARNLLLYQFTNLVDPLFKSGSCQPIQFIGSCL